MWEGIIPNKRRRTFNTFLRSDNPRIRAIAEEMAEEDRLSLRELPSQNHEIHE